MLKKEFVLLLVQERKRQKIKAFFVAERLGITQKHLSMFENNHSDLSLTLAIKYVEILGMKISLCTDTFAQ